MKPPVWTADIDIDAGRAARAIGACFPEFSSAAVVPFGVGWDNAAFLVDRRVVFRFPRRRIAVASIERELTLLPAIAPRLPLAISAPRFAGVAGPHYAARFAGYDLIAGSTACSIELDRFARAALAVPIARFLRSLHGIPAAPLVERGLPPDRIGRLDHEKRLRLTLERLPGLIAGGQIVDGDPFLRWLQTHPPVRCADTERTLVHGDLYARHLVLDALARPVGVIDWGDVHLGDPALDIALAHLVLPAEAHLAFRSAYGSVDERTWEAARYRAIYHAILELDYGVREDDAGMRAAGWTALMMIRPSIMNGS